MRVCYLVDGVREMIETAIDRMGEDGSVRLRATIHRMLCDTGSVDNMECAVHALRAALPSGAQIACCQSCAHGNFCPVGDREDEIFCMADIVPRTIRDVWRVTEDDAERERRARRLLFVCDRWREIKGENLYVYNEWGRRISRPS